MKTNWWRLRNRLVQHSDPEPRFGIWMFVVQILKKLGIFLEGLRSQINFNFKTSAKYL